MIPLGQDYVFDLDAMAAAIDDNTRLVFLGNPNNPTGTIYRKAQWHRFLERVPERVVIVADEAYFEFVRDPEYPDSIEDHDGRRMLVTLRTFSKIFGLAGLRVGYSVAREDITRLLNNVRQPFNITSLGLVAVEAGMDDHEHVRRTLEVNASGMAYLEGEFRRLGPAVRAEPGQFHPGRGRRGAYGLRKAPATGRNCPPDERLRAAAPRARQRRARGREPSDGGRARTRA